MTTMTKGKKGLKPKDRTLAVQKDDKKLQANQWQNTPQQNRFMAAWLDPESETFANAYQSALKAGYSENYATMLTAKSQGNEWLIDYHRASKMQLEHLEQKLITMINGRPDSKSPDDTKVKAIELLARLTGKLDNKGSGSTTNILVQPILNGESVRVKEPLNVTPVSVSETMGSTLEKTFEAPTPDDQVVDNLIDSSQYTN